MAKKIKSIEKVADKTYLTITYEEPLRQQIAEKDQRIRELQDDLKRLKKNWQISKTQQQKAYIQLKENNKQKGIVNYPIRLDGCKIANEEQLLDFAKDFILEKKEWERNKKVIKRALELAVIDKCKFENAWLSELLQKENVKMVVPKKEQYYIEQAEKELKGGQE